MSNPHLPTPPDANQEQPEVRLELTRAGVQEVLSLYSQEQRTHPDEPAFQLTLEDLEQAVRERRQLLLGGGLVGLGLALLVWAMSTPLYTVGAQVVLERHDMTRVESPGGAAMAGSAFVATQAEVMESQSVLTDALSQIPRAAHLEAEDDALADAVESVSTSPVSGTQVVALGYLGPDANHGVALLDAIVDAYLRNLRANEVAVQREKLRAKQAEIDVLEEEAVSLEDQLTSLRVEKGTTGSADDTARAQTDLMRDLAGQLADARNERIALENRLEMGSDQLSILDPATESLQQQLWDAEAELSRARLTLTSRHPAVEAAQREVTVLRRQLEQSSSATPEALARDIEAAKGLEAQLEELYDGARAHMSAIERDRREESLLLDELDRVRQLSDTRRAELLDQRLVSRLAESGELGISARLIAPPTLPRGPVWPRPPLILAGGGGLGLAAGLVLAILALRRERLARQREQEPAWVPPTQAPGRNGSAT
ncbi:MAG: hypothetical protein CL931_09300 [Deltaproteobacteria bacterium]|nr:hypothetical protein [Deltaproteobacteria bacterium]